MSQKECLYRFSQHLFWDTDRQNVDLETNAAFMVQRVLEYGLLEDWMLLRSYYGIERIAEVAKKLRSLEPRALSFIATLSNSNKSEFRCYTTKQSNQSPWGY